VIWQQCQQAELILVTANRNDDGPDSLESTIRTLGGPTSLPVFTFADVERFMADRAYAHRAADKFLQDLFDIDRYRGAGRVYIP
jgi:hypothetical protein